MKRFANALVATLSAGLLIVLVALVFIAPTIDFYAKSYLTHNNWIYVLMTLFMLGALVLVREPLIAFWHRVVLYFDTHARMPYIIIVCLGVILFIVQLIVIHLGWFVSGWDVANITDIAHLSVYENYYAQYPNNFFLGGVLVRLHALAKILGIEPYVLFCIVGAFGVTISIVEISIIAHEQVSVAVAFVTFAISAVLVGLHPWVLVPYSDAYSMVFVTTILFFATRARHVFLWTSLCALIAPFGYALKPTTIFMSLGAFIYLAKKIVAYSLAGNGDVFGIVRRSKKVAAVAINVLVAITLSLGSAGVGALMVSKVKDFGLNPDFETYGMPVSHWLMMGLNDETYGSYSRQDLVYLWQFETMDERKEYAAESIKLRLDDLGPTGVASLFGKKVLTVWNSGAFGWEPPGAYFSVRKDTNKALSWWYGYDSPEYEIPNHKNNVFEIPAQLLWVAILIGISSIAGLRGVHKNLTRKKNTLAYDFSFSSPIVLISFSLLMLTGYLMMFETNSRYIYLYTPEIVFLGVWGLWALVHTGAYVLEPVASDVAA